MFLVRADRDEIRVDVGGEIREAACGIADSHAMRAAFRVDLSLEITQKRVGGLTLLGDSPLDEEWTETMEQHDLRIGRESASNPLGRPTARRSTIDTNDDARELHDPPFR